MLKALVVFYNPSQEFIVDSLEVGRQTFLGSQALDEQFAALLRDLGQTVPFDIIAHSQGTQTTYNAFQELARQGIRLHKDSTAQFVGPIVPELQARLSAWRVGIRQRNVQFRANFRDPTNLLSAKDPVRIFGGAIGLFEGAINGFRFPAHSLDSYYPDGQ